MIPEIKEDILPSLFKYVRIFALTFVLPLWIAFIVNEVAVFWKIVNWFNLDIEFWTIKKYYAPTIIMTLAPIIYIVWFYYLVIKKLLLQLHEDFFKKVNVELGNLMADKVIQFNMNKESQEMSFDIESIVIFINEKLSKLPGILEWVARKLIDQIPLVEFANLYSTKNIGIEDKDKIANNITQKIDKIQIDIIEAIVPGWTKFIIPINIRLVYK